ncbi:MAG: hypothetical protein IPI15_13365 [Saprospiraceae bacterium]|jgi:hypothetical protein|uniref:DUF5777 family beta-barrel protein n=1 Tax=Candidatus Brachybacter algidus TaxID=2982024 RepID=UPI001B59A334|nr:DUF5777 family beta-barrel protein [Candidatus Brachybacter algidus]MBP7305389.1 hypothetical protein [Saprospiraceae bacterium]MBK7604549.1 hypothetical protein [Candidatus Brachybacter algidus]MBP7540094.1 hypothetical protein [Saprospiraceae bacterium]MBP8893102.1 hypothetical protein [Saprospiraceae bacterium]MBP9125509.1 hypothetical protein [Saprospiraceae bacterium]
MRSSYTFLVFFACLVISTAIYGQEDTSSMLSFMDEEEAPTINYAKASFKTNRIINLHSIENTAPGVMDVKISHRFGIINQGVYDIFGLDVAQMRIGYDLGITDRLCIGGGRSTLDKAFDGYIKYKVLRQSSGKRNMPISVSLVAGMALKTIKYSEPDRVNYFWSRGYYNFHLLLARKFSEAFTLQLTPSMVHRNLTKTKAEVNDVFALGIGARQKITKRLTVNLEYIYVLPDQLAEQYVNSLSVGFDLETGGHVFQMHFTNSQGMNENAFITETVNKWDKFEFRFGFNLSRVFTLWDPKRS